MTKSKTKALLLDELSSLIFRYDEIRKQLAAGLEVDFEELKNLDKRKEVILGKIKDFNGTS